MQQKDASRYLTILWQRDPFKAKWALIAAAYSKLRDEIGKANAPLKEFLAIVCPEMGSMDSETYLGRMNWTCQVQFDGTISWQQESDPILANLEPNILYSAMTVDDIINLCARFGYTSHIPCVSLGRGRTPSHHPSSTSISRQGLLTSRPTLPAREMRNTVTYSTCTTAGNTAKARFDNMSGSETGLLWTGTMSEVYSPPEGSAEFEERSMRTWQTRQESASYF